MAKTKKTVLKFGDMFDAFVEGGNFEIGIVWSPGKSNPVTCGHLRVNDVVLALDQEFINSPQVFRLPPPIDGKFAVDWSLTPEVPLDGILIGIVNWDTRKRAVVDSQRKPGRAEWSGQKVVDAP